jgi:hypothetical protein
LIFAVMNRQDYHPQSARAREAELRTQFGSRNLESVGIDDIREESYCALE